jgi:hypothetical protein
MVLARMHADEPAETRLLSPSITDRGSTGPHAGPAHPLTAPSITPVVK